jgi:hypothetical protein
MNITYTTKIDKFTNYQTFTTTSTTLTNVVYCVNWTLTGTDSDSGQSASVCYFTNIPFIDDGNFSTFESLTESVVIDWVTQHTDITIMDLYKNQIVNTIQTNLNSVHSIPPWAIQPGIRMTPNTPGGSY